MNYIAIVDLNPTDMGETITVTNLRLRMVVKSQREVVPFVLRWARGHQFKVDAIALGSNADLRVKVPLWRAGLDPR